MSDLSFRSESVDPIPDDFQLLYLNESWSLPSTPNLMKCLLFFLIEFDGGLTRPPTKLLLTEFAADALDSEKLSSEMTSYCEMNLEPSSLSRASKGEASFSTGGGISLTCGYPMLLSEEKARTMSIGFCSLNDIRFLILFIYTLLLIILNIFYSTKIPLL